LVDVRCQITYARRLQSFFVSGSCGKTEFLLLNGQVYWVMVTQGYLDSHTAAKMHNDLALNSSLFFVLQLIGEI
jgi:hypothetical protein